MSGSQPRVLAGESMAASPASVANHTGRANPGPASHASLASNGRVLVARPGHVDPGRDVDLITPDEPDNRGIPTARPLLVPPVAADQDAVPSLGAKTPRRVRIVKLALVVADLLAVTLAMAASSSLHQILPNEVTDAQVRQFAVSVLSLPLWVAFLVHYRLYNVRHIASRLREFGRVVHAAGASVMATAALAFMLRLYVPRSWLVLTFVFSVMSLTAARDVVRRVFDAQRRRGRFKRSVVIVGANGEARELATMLDSSPVLSYQVAGFVDDEVPVGTIIDGHPVLGSISDTAAIVECGRLGGVLIATSALGFKTSSNLARQLSAANIHVELLSGLCDVASERLTVRSLGRLAVLYVEPARRDGWRGVAKRAFDITIASTALVLCLPLLAVVVVAIKINSRGPVLFRQTRIGQAGQSFQILKLRTMVKDAESRIAELHQHNEADGPLFKMTNDPRITSVGRWLRRLSIDEIPQLWNVLRGDMSLVGPRPALPHELHGWSPELHERLLVRPGITGMWQVSGRAEASFEDYVRLDLYYVHNWSLWTDLAMLAKTIPTVVSRRGAC
ncbi:sugar transferase [soil metagenome]